MKEITETEIDKNIITWLDVGFGNGYMRGAVDALLRLKGEDPFFNTCAWGNTNTILTRKRRKDARGKLLKQKFGFIPENLDIWVKR